MILIGHLSINSVNIFAGYKTEKVTNTLLVSCYNINNDHEIIQELKPYNNHTTVFHSNNLTPKTVYTFCLRFYYEGGADIFTKTINITTQNSDVDESKIVIGLCS